jgi:hypothetical protein
MELCGDQTGCCPESINPIFLSHPHANEGHDIQEVAPVHGVKYFGDRDGALWRPNWVVPPPPAFGKKNTE